MNPHTIKARNVNVALSDGLHWLAAAGSVNASRNGPVLVAPGPVLTAYLKPQERVLFSPLRDANPFFHLFECIWMLAGRNDSASVARYAKTMDSFADNGILAGSYGHRWRRHFGFDQLPHIADMIKRDRKTRRAVLTMWDPESDLELGEFSKDVPCNTAVYFDGTRDVLDMTVVNRSNDIVWGAYGANVVHMSFLQEVIAAAVGMPVGTYYQFSNNFHTYVERPDVARLLRPVSGAGCEYSVAYQIDNRYAHRVVMPDPVVHFYPVAAEDASSGKWELERFLNQCEALMEDPTTYRSEYYPFLRNVFQPMVLAHNCYKAGNFEDATNCVGWIKAADWQMAAGEWLQRRAAKAEGGAA